MRSVIGWLGSWWLLCEGVDAVYEHSEVLRVHVRVDTMAEVGYPVVSTEGRD